MMQFEEDTMPAVVQMEAATTKCAASEDEIMPAMSSAPKMVLEPGTTKSAAVVERVPVAAVPIPTPAAAVAPKKFPALNKGLTPEMVSARRQQEICCRCDRKMTKHVLKYRGNYVGRCVHCEKRIVSGSAVLECYYCQCFTCDPGICVSKPKRFWQK